MKRLNIRYNLLLLLGGLAVALPSCLKNNSFYVDFSKGNPAVELPLAAVHTNQPFAVSFDVSSTPSQYYAVVNVASVNKPGSAVTATLALDTAYLSAYNAEQAAADPNYVPYELMPDSTYTIGSLDVTIQPGHREDSIPIQIITSKLDAGHIYILPLTIVKSSLPISNWNHLMLNVGAKNKWDGIYKVVSAEFYHPSYGDQIWDASAGITQKLITTGVNSVASDNIKTPAVTFGISLEITIKADNSLVEVLNGTQTPLPNNDHYDPATRTFYVSGGYSTRKYKAVYTYVKPR